MTTDDKKSDNSKGPKRKHHEGIIALVHLMARHGADRDFARLYQEQPAESKPGKELPK